jgi:hypothetical protein
MVLCSVFKVKLCTVGGGGRHRYEVLHRGVREQTAVLLVLLDRVGQPAHQTHAPRHPAHAAIEAPRQLVEGQAMVFMQRAQQLQRLPFAE